MPLKTSIAFFLSNRGDLIHVPDSHISTVIAEPERFGLTPAEIQTVYKEHRERVGVEGEARKETLLKIIADGWIRLRRYPNRHWSETAERFTAVEKGFLCTIADLADGACPR